MRRLCHLYMLCMYVPLFLPIDISRDSIPVQVRIQGSVRRLQYRTDVMTKGAVESARLEIESCTAHITIYTHGLKARQGKEMMFDPDHVYSNGRRVFGTLPSPTAWAYIVSLSRDYIRFGISYHILGPMGCVCFTGVSLY